MSNRDFMQSKRSVLRTIITLLLLIITVTGWSQKKPLRVAGSPYPVAPKVPTLIYDLDNYKPLTIQTLQGVLAKSGIFLYRHISAPYDNYLTDLKDNYGVIINSTYRSAESYSALLKFFKKKIKGYILCNSGDNSTNVAVSLCGILNSIAVTSDDIELMKTIGIPMIHDVRGKDEQWALTNYGDKFSKKILGYQVESKSVGNLSDYSVFAGAFHFYDNPNSDLSTQAFSRMETPAAGIGWGSEFGMVQAMSKKSLYLLPADWANNLSVLSNFNAKKPLVQKSQKKPFSMIPATHTVCFLMSDGDNIQWLLGGFLSGASFFGNSNRGKVNIGWTVSPSLSEMAPTVLDLIYQRAANEETGRDVIVAAASGAGYFFPGGFPKLNELMPFQSGLLSKAGMRIVDILNAGKWNESLLTPYLNQPEIDGIFYYPYENNYIQKRNSTEIMWINNKPAITARTAMWKGVESPATLAKRLNDLPKDPTIAEGYSLIAVHCWSYGVNDIISCVSQLGPDVRVVAPDEFVWLITHNVTHN
jgi:hypothetical protein